MSPLKCVRHKLWFDFCFHGLQSLRGDKKIMSPGISAADIRGGTCPRQEAHSRAIELQRSSELLEPPYRWDPFVAGTRRIG